MKCFEPVQGLPTITSKEKAGIELLWLEHVTEFSIDHVACALIQDEGKMIQDYSRYLESLESAVHGMCNWLYSSKHLGILHCQLQ